jgi:ubiquinone/menaquinone biosynthesis C-methylase UbiE
LFRREYLICPRCTGNNLHFTVSHILCLQCGATYEIVEGIPILLKNDFNNGEKFSKAKWEEHWSEYKEKIRLRNEWFDKYVQMTFDFHIGNFVKKDEVFLEIGSGPGRFALEAAKRGADIVAVDFCYEPLAVLKEDLKKLGLNGTLICGDIKNIPLRDDLVDFSYGGGVIEHFRDTSFVVREICRITKPRGYAFNFVPAIGLAFIYAQLWGTIPEISCLRELFELIHIKMFKGKHMKYGYEKAFTERKLKTIFGAYFRKDHMETGVFKFPSTLGFIKNEHVKDFVRLLLAYRLFSHKIFIVAQK